MDINGSDTHIVAVQVVENMYMKLLISETLQTINLARLIENQHQGHPDSVLVVELALSHLEHL